MSDHYHYEYAEARHDHRGEYADERHDHDLDYAGKHHRHYDLEREDERLKVLMDAWYADVRELREDLRDALERIRALEDRQPDCAGPDAAEDESWRSTLADYHVASGGAGYDEDGADCGCGLGAARCRALEDGEVPE
jgi:hypothetical protein